MEAWRTAAEVQAARSAMEAALPGWRAPCAYGLGVVGSDGVVGWRVVNSPNLHQLPAVVLATVLGYGGGTATFDIGLPTFDEAIARLAPAGACDAFEHPNLWAWQRLRTDLTSGLVPEGARIVVVFVGDAGDAPSSEADDQFRRVAGIGEPGLHVVAGVAFRRATAGDIEFLREMLYLALFVPPGASPFPPEVVYEPALARLVEGFGMRAGDAGWVALAGDGSPSGAAWVRRLTADAPGFGYIDDVTPELSIAVVDTHRGQGVGSHLLGLLLADVGRMCLSVDVRNPALRLYARLGFTEVRRDGSSATMLHRG